MAVKRRLDEEGGDAPCRPKVEDAVLRGRCGVVAGAIAMVPTLPQETREMLAAAVEMSRGVPQGERDVRQATVVGFIGETLVQHEAALAECIEVTEAEIQGAKAGAAEALRVAAARSAEAEAAFAASKQDLERQLAALDEEIDAVRKAVESFKAAEAAQSGGEADLLAASVERQLCEEGCLMLQQGLEQRLRKGIVKDEGVLQEHIAVLQKIAMKLGLEESLVLTMPNMVRKVPEERSFLDRAAADILQDALTKHAVALGEQITQGTSSVSSREEALQAARVAQAEGEARRTASAETLGHMQAESEKRKAELEAARSAEKECASQLRKVEVPCDDARLELAHFRDGPLATFHMLRGEDKV